VMRRGLIDYANDLPRALAECARDHWRASLPFPVETAWLDLVRAALGALHCAQLAGPEPIFWRWLRADVWRWWLLRNPLPRAPAALRRILARALEAADDRPRGAEPPSIAGLSSGLGLRAHVTD
jgi:hypothetical protein